jgi:hypothetical protein
MLVWLQQIEKNSIEVTNLSLMLVKFPQKKKWLLDLP